MTRVIASQETRSDLLEYNTKPPGAGHTERLLTHPLEISKGGLAMNASAEIWKPVVGYEGYYEVSNMGRVRSVDRIIHRSDGRTRIAKARILKPFGSKYGHLELKLYRDANVNNCQVHRLVLEAFVGRCPDGMECCHNNGIADDNRLENLRWDTPSANQYDSVRHGTHVAARKTHCKNGHPLTPGNYYIRNNGGRNCKQCVVDGWRRRNPPKPPKTHCKRGHEYTHENLYVRSDGARHCRTCNIERSRRKRAERGLKP